MLNLTGSDCILHCTSHSEQFPCFYSSDIELNPCWLAAILMVQRLPLKSEHLVFCQSCPAGTHADSLCFQVKQKSAVVVLLHVL